MKKIILITLILSISISCKLFSQSWTHYDVLNTIPDNTLPTNYFRTLSIDTMGAYWLPTRDFGISIFNNGDVEVLSTNNGLVSNNVSYIHQDKIGNTWIRYSEEYVITRFDGNSFTHYDLPSSNIQKFHLDSNGNIWLKFGYSDTCGVATYNDNSWTVYNKDNGLASNMIKAIQEDKNGNICLTYSKHYPYPAVGFSIYNANNWKTYTIADGLLSNEVNNLFIASNGDLWINYNGAIGLSKLSNNSITSYTISEGLLSNNCSAVHEDIHGNIWLICYNDQGSGQAEGISKFDGNSFTNYTIEDGLSATHVSNFLNDISGNVWINYYPIYNGTFMDHGEPTGITRYDGEVFTNFTEDNGLANNLISRIQNDHNGHLWFSHYDGYQEYDNNSGITNWDGNSFNIYNTSTGLNSNKVYNIFSQTNGDIWFLDGGKNGISVLSDQTITNYSIDDGLSSNGPYRGIFEDDEDRIILTGYGLSILDDSWNSYTKVGGLQEHNINSISQDDAGTFFFSSDYGVTIYKNNNWTNYNSYNGLASTSTKKTLTTSRLGSWALHGIHQNNGLSHYNGNQWSIYDTSNYLLSNSIYGLHEDPLGNLWIQNIGVGLTRYDGDTWLNYDTSNGMHSNYFENLVFDHQGNVWGYSWQGASYFNGESWQSYNSNNGLAHNLVQDIFIASNGDAWISYPFWCDDLCSFPWQITKYNGESFESFSLDDNIFLVNGRLIEDKDGQLWSTSHKGIIHFDGINWNIINTDDGLASNSVYEIFIDKDNTKWFFTNSGISTYDSLGWNYFNTNNVLAYNNIDQVIQGDNGDLWFKYYTGYNQSQYYGIITYDGELWTSHDTSNGLASNKVNSIFMDQSGAIWACTDKGFNKYTEASGWTEQEVITINIMEIIPNPILNSAEINFELQDKSHVSLTLYDSQGKLVQTIGNKEFSRGKQKIRINLGNYPSGNYYCNLKINGTILETDKIIKI